VSRDGQQVVVRRTLLWLGEHPEIHAAQHSTGVVVSSVSGRATLVAQGCPWEGSCGEVIGWSIRLACRLADAAVRQPADPADGGEIKRPTR